MMKHENLTNADVAKVFALFIGCYAKYKSDRENATTVRKFTGLITDSRWDDLQQYLFEYDNGTRDMVYFKDQQPLLLLTPIAKISDEDAERVRKMEGFVSEFSMEELKLMIQYQLFYLTHCTYVYLINQGYDMPLYFCSGTKGLNTKTAIELGLAIDKTEVQ